MDHPILKKRKITTIDCLEMVCPEPMVSVLEAVAQMQPDEAILMHNRISPIHLYPKLEERGLHYELLEESEESIQLLIWQGSP